MLAQKFFAVVAFAASSIGGALAVPAPSPTINSACPYTYTSLITETLSILAPTTTGPFETTTITATIVSYPLATTTHTESYIFSGTVWVGSPTYTPTVTEYSTTITAVEVYTNYVNNPPYPSDCYQ